jgi:hypothetical protein
LQNARPLGLELLGEPLVSLLSADGDGEGDEVEPSPYGLVDRAQARLVIAGGQESELWGELEEVGAHEASGNAVAARQHLDLGLGPSPAFLGLLGRDEPGAAEHREFGRVSVA